MLDESGIIVGQDPNILEAHMQNVDIRRGKEELYSNGEPKNRLFTKKNQELLASISVQLKDKLNELDQLRIKLLATPINIIPGALNSAFDILSDVCVYTSSADIKKSEDKIVKLYSPSAQELSEAPPAREFFEFIMNTVSSLLLAKKLQELMPQPNSDNV